MKLPFPIAIGIYHIACGDPRRYPPPRRNQLRTHPAHPGYPPGCRRVEEKKELQGKHTTSYLFSHAERAEHCCPGGWGRARERVPPRPSEYRPHPDADDGPGGRRLRRRSDGDLFIDIHAFNSAQDGKGERLRSGAFERMQSALVQSIVLYPGFEKVLLANFTGAAKGIQETGLESFCRIAQSLGVSAQLFDLGKVAWKQVPCFLQPVGWLCTPS